MDPRPATPDDTAAIERIVAGAYRPYIAMIGREPAPMREDYGRLIRDGMVWVAEDGGAVSGLVVLLPQADHLLLDNLAVAPEAQGRGLGRHLEAFAEAEARRGGYSRLVLYTNVVMTRNIALYTRWGWGETHRAAEDGFHRVYMEKAV